MQMVAVLPEAAATVVLTAAFTGLRRGEIRGMRWENLESGEPLAFYRVSQSIWKGIVTEPKTAKSKAPVPIIGLLAKRLTEHRARCGNPESGAMFTNSLRNTLDLNELYQRIIKDILAAAHISWHGWHAFRRGLATNLHRLGVDDKTIQAILRHCNVAVTQNVYIKTVSADSVAAMQQLEKAVSFSDRSHAQA
jgi:integrase